LRASTAAPYYFPPEIIRLDPTDPSSAFAFADGGTTAYNNPASLMARMATEPAYRLGWSRGERQLLIVSLGTGAAPAPGMDPESRATLLDSFRETFAGLFSQTAFDQDLSCRTFGRCVIGPQLDRELKDLVPRDEAGESIPLSHDLGRAFLYARYDQPLTFAGLCQLKLEHQIDATRIRKLDSVDGIDELCTVGRAIAERVSLAQLGSFIDLPLSPLRASRA
jgi:hypothetical protein